MRSVQGLGYEEIGEAILLDRRFAFEGRRLSSAGGIATMDMLLALIEKARGSVLETELADSRSANEKLKDLIQQIQELTE